MQSKTERKKQKKKKKKKQTDATNTGIITRDRTKSSWARIDSKSKTLKM
jgi:hypothetical protein